MKRDVRGQSAAGERKIVRERHMNRCAGYPGRCFISLADDFGAGLVEEFAEAAGALGQLSTHTAAADERAGV